MESEEIKTKIVFLGDSSVGKSSILKRLQFNSFDTHNDSTIGCEFTTKDIQLSEKKVKLLLWDTAGQEVFRSFTQNFFRGAKVVVIVYSIVSKISFLNIESWIKETEKIKNISIVIVGNKSDLSNNIDLHDIKKLKEKYKALYFFENNVSAKDGKNINELFEFIAEICIKHNYNSIKKYTIELNKESEEISRCC